MTYVVISPVKTYDGTKIIPTLVTDDVEEAKGYARQQRDRLTARGFHHWAKHIKVLAPKTSEGYRELSAQILEYGHDLDFAKNGNSIYAQNLIGWGNKLRRLANEAQA